jgi:hypothetical protein
VKHRLPISLPFERAYVRQRSSIQPPNHRSGERQTRSSRSIRQVQRRVALVRCRTPRPKGWDCLTRRHRGVQRRQPRVLRELQRSLRLRGPALRIRVFIQPKNSRAWLCPTQCSKVKPCPAVRTLPPWAWSRARPGEYRERLGGTARRSRARTSTVHAKARLLPSDSSDQPLAPLTSAWQRRGAVH